MALKFHTGKPTGIRRLHRLIRLLFLLLTIPCVLMVFNSCDFKLGELSSGQFRYRFLDNSHIAVVDTLLTSVKGDTTTAFRLQVVDGDDLVFHWQKRASTPVASGQEALAEDLWFQLPDSVDRLSIGNDKLADINLFYSRRFSSLEEQVSIPVTSGSLLAEKLSATVWLIDLHLELPTRDRNGALSLEHIFVRDTGQL